MTPLTRDFHPSQVLLVDKTQRYGFWGAVVCSGSVVSLMIALMLSNNVTVKGILYTNQILLTATSWYLSHMRKQFSEAANLSHYQATQSLGLHLQTAYAPSKKTDIAFSSQQISLPDFVEAPTYYDWNNIADEAVGFLICGNSGSAKSSLATWLAGHLSHSQPMAVIALDPHFNDCWKLAGITSIGKIEQIEAALNWLLTELDARCDRKGAGLPLGDHLFVICDELNASLERFKDRKVVESTLRRLGSEGRKFGLTFCGLNQSSNAAAIGIDAKYRSNYALILLGQSARTHPQFKEALKDVAYPCLLDGSIAPALAVHPTHGDYKIFKKQGNPPKNLKQIKQLPLPSGLTAIINSASTAFVEELEPIDNPKTATVSVKSEAVIQDEIVDTNEPLYPHLQKIVDYLDGREWVKDNQIKESITVLKKGSTADDMRGYLRVLKAKGYVEIRSIAGSRNSLEARKI